MSAGGESFEAVFGAGRGRAANHPAGAVALDEWDETFTDAKPRTAAELLQFLERFDDAIGLYCLTPHDYGTGKRPTLEGARRIVGITSGSIPWDSNNTKRVYPQLDHSPSPALATVGALRAALEAHDPDGMVYFEPPSPAMSETLVGWQLFRAADGTEFLALTTVY